MLALLNQLDHVLVCLILVLRFLFILLGQVHVIEIGVDQVVEEVISCALRVFFLFFFVSTVSLLFLMLLI